MRLNLDTLSRTLDSLLTERIARSYVAIVDSPTQRGVRQGGKAALGCGSGRWTPPRLDTVYDVASVTKIVATWATIGNLIRQGKLSLDTCLGDILGIPNTPASGLTIKQLLTHTGGLMEPTWLRRYNAPRQTLCEKIMAEPLEFTTGPPARYNERGFILLGFVCEAIAETSLDLAADAAIWKPLGMRNTCYNPNITTQTSIAPTEIDRETGRRLCGVVHDENARVLGGVAGHAGAFSTADDLVRFGRALLDGEADSVLGGFFREAVSTNVEWKRHEKEKRSGLGWGVYVGGKRMVAFHYGYTGVSFFLVPDDGAVVVLLTNSVYYGRRQGALSPIRADILTRLGA